MTDLIEKALDKAEKLEKPCTVDFIRVAFETVLREMMEPTEEMERVGRYEIGVLLDAADHFGLIANVVFSEMLSTFAKQHNIDIEVGDE